MKIQFSIRQAPMLDKIFPANRVGDKPTSSVRGLIGFFEGKNSSISLPPVPPRNKVATRDSGPIAAPRANPKRAGTQDSVSHPGRRPPLAPKPHSVSQASIDGGNPLKNGKPEVVYASIDRSQKTAENKESMLTAREGTLPLTPSEQLSTDGSMQTHTAGSSPPKAPPILPHQFELTSDHTEQAPAKPPRTYAEYTLDGQRVPSMEDLAPDAQEIKPERKKVKSSMFQRFRKAVISRFSKPGVANPKRTEVLVRDGAPQAKNKTSDPEIKRQKEMMKWESLMQQLESRGF